MEPIFIGKDINIAKEIKAFSSIGKYINLDKILTVCFEVIIQQ
jgi:hypothetical protein